MMDRIFLEHPRELGEGYFQHQRAAFRYARTLLKASLAAFVHGLFPCLCKTTASRTVVQLHTHMQHRGATEWRQAAE